MKSQHRPHLHKTQFQTAEFPENRLKVESLCHFIRKQVAFIDTENKPNKENNSRYYKKL